MHERRYNHAVERLRDTGRVERLEVERVTRLALEGLPGAKSVLDIGTGTGLFAQQFAALGLQVTGLDANPEMLAAARQHVPGGVFEEGVAEKLPFPDGSFDLVFMGLLLHETDDRQAALREARRVATRRLAVLEWPEDEGSFGPQHEHRLSFEAIHLMAQQAGFKEARRTRLNNVALYLFE